MGGDQLAIDWMEGQPAPEAVLDLLACNRARQMRCIGVYMSLSNGHKCNEMCTLTNCENKASASEESDNNEMTDGETAKEELETDNQV